MDEDSILLKDMTMNKKKDDQISQELLKKYILYARHTCTPKLSQVDRKKISNFYTKLRDE